MTAFVQAGNIMGRMRRFRETVVPTGGREAAKFKCLDLVKEAMEIHDRIPDYAGGNEICREMIRGEIGKLQEHFGWQ